jgi:hypothetical protein
MVQQIALKYNNLSDFRKNDSLAYEAAKRYDWFDDITSHIPKEVKEPLNYENVKKEASKYPNRKQFINNNRRAYNFAEKNGWIDEFFPVKFKNQFDNK